MISKKVRSTEMIMYWIRSGYNTSKCVKHKCERNQDAAVAKPRWKKRTTPAYTYSEKQHKDHYTDNGKMNTEYCESSGKVLKWWYKQSLVNNPRTNTKQCHFSAQDCYMQRKSLTSPQESHGSTRGKHKHQVWGGRNMKTWELIKDVTNYD